MKLAEFATPETSNRNRPRASGRAKITLAIWRHDEIHSYPDISLDLADLTSAQESPTTWSCSQI